MFCFLFSMSQSRLDGQPGTGQGLAGDELGGKVMVLLSSVLCYLLIQIKTTVLSSFSFHFVYLFYPIISAATLCGSTEGFNEVWVACVACIQAFFKQ